MSDITIECTPAKGFFVHMLTRDIDLDDAILDLIDNSIDGLTRLARDDYKEYSKYKVNIVIKKDTFMIEDNCGGIPTSVAEKYAFRMGRPSNYPDGENIPTIGLYGIGMKRSVFKMGQNILITSKNKDKDFSVLIDDTWLKDDSNWDLKMSNASETLEKQGTKILVKHLHPGVSNLFDTNEFIRGLREKISICYSFVLKKGFGIFVNGEEIIGREIEFLFGEYGEESMRPYFYQEEQDGLKITIMCGLVGQPEDEDLDKDIPSYLSYGAIESGWTISCNNRIVLYADRTRLTGWGDRLPRFHYQFNSIVGIVKFESNDPSKLPMTTTKKGIDASSDVFLRIREKMINATKFFTSYTNAWKNKRDIEKSLIISKSELKSSEDTIAFMNKQKLIKGEYIPNTLPKPKKEKNKETVATIKFDAEKDKISEIADYFFEDKNHNKNKVGEKCFEVVYVRIKKGLNI